MNCTGARAQNTPISGLKFQKYFHGTGLCKYAGTEIFQMTLMLIKLINCLNFVTLLTTYDNRSKNIMFHMNIYRWMKRWFHSKAGLASSSIWKTSLWNLELKCGSWPIQWRHTAITLIYMLAGSHKEWTGSHKEWTGSHKEWTGSHKEWTGSHKEWTGSHKEWTGSLARVGKW